MFSEELHFQAPDFYAAPRKQSSTSINYREKPHPERMAQLLDSGPADTVGQSSGKGDAGQKVRYTFLCQNLDFFSLETFDPDKSGILASAVLLITSM